MREVRIKVLYKDLDKEEQGKIKNKLNNIKLGRIYNHCWERMKQKNISVRECYEVLKMYDIIEVNFTYKKQNDMRVLLRGRAEDKSGYCTCLVMNISTGDVCTVWKNKATDTHKTLNKCNYLNVNNNLVLTI